VIRGLDYLAIVVSLAVAAWAFVDCARMRAPGQTQYLGMGVVWVLVAAQGVVATVRLAGGAGPATTSDTVTFVGYLLTTVLLPVAGVVLARMEPTRWGSALVGAAAVIVPVLVVRMLQVWNG
jgi:hypothetical protein